jgi:hypothetical protein
MNKVESDKFKEAFMPTISMFYGIIVYMFFYYNKKHQLPHIHAKYAESDAVFSIDSGELLDGEFPRNKRKLVEAWIEIHREDLMTDWDLAVSGQNPLPIKPLE